MGVILDVAKTLELMNECVQERGEDFVYEPPEPDAECRYWHTTEGEGGPGCIVGMVLHKAGIPGHVLDADDIATVGVVHLHTDLVRTGWIGEHGPVTRITAAARQMLSQAQMDQDNHRPWGKVLSNSVTEFGERENEQEKGTSFD